MTEISFSSKQKLFYAKLQQLLKSKTFNDVTFNCKDGKTRGNRLVLSVYSSVLKDVFKDNPLLAEHPKSHPENGIVLLQSSVYDVNNLLSILNSRMSLEISRHSLSGVLDIAKVFDIKLITKNVENDRVLVKAIVQKGIELSDVKPPKIKEEVDEMSGTDLADSESNCEVSTDKRTADSKRKMSINDNGAENVDDGEEGDLDDSELAASKVSQRARCSSQSSTISNGSNEANARASANLFVDDKYYQIQHVKGLRLYRCKLCPKSYENVSRIRNHFQVKHLTLIFRCTKCSQEFDTRYNVVKHVKTAHKINRGWRHFYTHSIIGSESA